LLVLGSPSFSPPIISRELPIRPPPVSLSASDACSTLRQTFFYSRLEDTALLFVPTLVRFLAIAPAQYYLAPRDLSLQRLIVNLNVEMLNLVGIPATQRANVIQLPHCVVGVDSLQRNSRLQSSIMASLFIGC
jgi:hypothetical protein